MNWYVLKVKGHDRMNDYIYPSWSNYVGWLILIFSLLPIPLVYLINYLKEYRSMKSENDDEMACYLKSFKEINLPRDDWGPLKSVNQYGLYCHLNQVKSCDENDFEVSRTSLVTRRSSLSDQSP